MTKLYLVTSKYCEALFKEKELNLVYPLKGFCVGVTYLKNYDEINDGYIYINRILNCDDIDKLKDILKKISSNIKGIIFQDLGIINLLKNYNFKKIFFNPHFNCNYLSVNEYFNYVDDIILPFDITEDEIDEIISKSNKKISLYVFGLMPLMYSRRNLISNYEKHYNLNLTNKKDLYLNKERFISIENEYGTIIYHYPYFNGTCLLQKKCEYLFYAPILIEDKFIENIINDDFSCVENDTGFLYKKTIYKVKEPK